MNTVSEHSMMNRRKFAQIAALGLASVGATIAIPPLHVKAKNTRTSRDLGFSDLIYLSASEQLELFKSKKLSPVEVLQAQIKRAEAIEPLVNVYTYTHYDSAIAAAKESEKRYMQGNPRPLEGITVAIKDEYDKVGWITTAGSKLLENNVAKTNHPAVNKLLGAGAVIHAQTTVPEMYLTAVTWTDLWGVTRNPWNLDYTVGGSSGGSGGALAAGMTTLATGSDMGGSTRIPCAFNGLYGFKPPYGRNAPPPDSVFLLPATEGPLARTFTDMVHLQNVMAGPAPYTATALRPKLTLPLTYTSIKGWRIAFTLDQGWAEVDADTRQNTEQALDILRQQGAIVETVDLNLGMDGVQIRQAITYALLTGGFGADMATLNDYADQLTTYGRYFAGVAAQEMGIAQAKEAEETISYLYAKVQDAVFLKGYKAVVMPTLATSNIAADYDPTKDSTTINGQVVDPHVGWFLTPLWNLLNWNPVVSIPTGLNRNQVPTGLQIATPTYEDETAMQIAAAYAQAAPALFTGDRLPKFLNAQKYAAR